MWKQRGLDGLEQQQRRAGDEQHVEDDAGQRPVRRGGGNDEHGGGKQDLLGQLDAGNRKRKARSATHREIRGCLFDTRGRRSLECGVGIRNGWMGGQRHGGCSVCTGGQGTFTYSYATSSFANGYNNWADKTVETLPDGSTNTVYANYAGETMLDVFQNGGQKWETFYKYDGSGRIM